MPSESERVSFLLFRQKKKILVPLSEHFFVVGEKGETVRLSQSFSLFKFLAMTTDGLSAISRLLMAGYRLTSDGCQRCGGPMMQEGPQPRVGGTASASASSTLINSSPPSRSVCARCDAGQLRSVLNRLSTAATANGVHEDEEEVESESKSDEDEDGICGVDAAFSRLATAGAARQPAQPPRPRRRANPPAAAAVAASDPDLPPSDREPSAAMGDLLLKGWTMLGEACPACGGTTPLMRKRGGGLNEGRTYCVKCRAWVRYQAEGEEEEEEEYEEDEAVPAAGAARAPAAAAAAAAPCPSPASTTSAGPLRRTSAAATAVSEAEDSALVEARQALVEALRDATLALRQRRGGSVVVGGGNGGGDGGNGGGDGGSETDGARASAARLVGECARALAAVRAALGAARA